YSQIQRIGGYTSENAIFPCHVPRLSFPTDDESGESPGLPTGGIAMARYLMVALAGVVCGSAASAGGPAPVYGVVDKVVREPSADGADRIRIEGCFVRLEDAREYRYGKPVEGYVYLSIAPGKEKECRAEWEKWPKAAGTGKAVCVGSCGEAGPFLTVTIHKPGEKVEKPDAA